MTDKDKEPQDARLGGERPKNSKLPYLERRRKSHSGSKIFNLFIIAFIGYAVYVYMQKGGDAGILNELGDHLKVIEAPQEGDLRIDRLKHHQRANVLARIVPKERLGVTWSVLQKGEGAPVSCGQEATYSLISGFGSDQTVSKPRMLRLGSVKAPQGLTLGLEGMRVGEVRQVKVPQRLWSGSQPAEGQPARLTTITLELKNVSGQVPQAEMPLRRFFIRGGGGHPLRCGDLAIMHLTLWSGEGKKLFSSLGGKPVYFYLGEGQVPYGLERGVLEMAPGGLYSLALSPELMRPLAPDTVRSAAPPYAVQPFPADLALPEGQMVLIDIDYPKELPPTVSRRLPEMQSPATQAPVTNPQIKE